MSRNTISNIALVVVCVFIVAVCYATGVEIENYSLAIMAMACFAGFTFASMPKWVAKKYEEME